jgi:hypothetical protein
MWKKIIGSILLIGLIGILVWGGVNRTLAKTNPSEGGNDNNQSAVHVDYAEGNSVQQRGNGTLGSGNPARNVENTESLENIAEQDTAISQETNNGKGSHGDSAKENSAASGDGISYTASADSQVQNQGNGNRGGRGNGQGTGQGSGSEPLTATEIEALNLALDDEYHALAVYQAVIATFGEVEPFVEIAASEQRHIDALLNHYDKHGFAIPENPWIGNVPTFESVQQACQAGVAAEIGNAELYERLFRMTDDASLLRVFTNLRNASLNSHLPQLEACQ